MSNVRHKLLEKVLDQWSGLSARTTVWLEEASSSALAVISSLLAADLLALALLHTPCLTRHCNRTLALLVVLCVVVEELELVVFVDFDFAAFESSLGRLDLAELLL